MNGLSLGAADRTGRERKWRNPFLSLNSVQYVGMLLCVSFCSDINEEDNDGLSALHVATALEVVKYLIEKGGVNISKGLHAAASAGELDTVQYLIENNADIDARNKSGQTPLICAAMNDKLDVVSHLVDCKADVQAEDDVARTALDWAKHNNHISIIALLASKGK